METALSTTTRLLAEKYSGGYEPAAWRRLDEQLAALKFAADMSTFEAIKDAERAARGVRGFAGLALRCACGHRSGFHGLTGCQVGHVKWNRREGRNDPFCGCTGFLEAAEAARLAATEATERAAARAEADYWCTGCDEAIDEADLTVRYECGNCGNEFTYADEGSNRCPECSRFATKVSETACPDCGEDVSEGGS